MRRAGANALTAAGVTLGTATACVHMPLCLQCPFRAFSFPQPLPRDDSWSAHSSEIEARRVSRYFCMMQPTPF